MQSFALKGNIVYAPALGRLEMQPQSFFTRPGSLSERIESLIFMRSGQDLLAKFVAGNRFF